MKIYVAGPIDYVRGQDVDRRHRRLADEARAQAVEAEIWCPVCEYDSTLDPASSVSRNMAALGAADAVVVEWDAAVQPSFGTPVEIWIAATLGTPVVVMGDLGTGLFAKYLRLQQNVKEVDTWRMVMGLLTWGRWQPSSASTKPD